MRNRDEDRRVRAAIAAQQARSEQVVAVQRDGRGRVVALQLARGDRVTASTGYWMIYVDRYAFHVRTPDETGRAYIQVVTPTATEGPYFRIRHADANQDALDRLPECGWPESPDDAAPTPG